jgi:hypothetical protein
VGEMLLVFTSSYLLVIFCLASWWVGGGRRDGGMGLRGGKVRMVGRDLLLARELWERRGIRGRRRMGKGYLRERGWRRDERCHCVFFLGLQLIASEQTNV